MKANGQDNEENDVATPCSPALSSFSHQPLPPSASFWGCPAAGSWSSTAIGTTEIHGPVSPCYLGPVSYGLPVELFVMEAPV